MCCNLHSLVLSLYTPELFFFILLVFVLLFASEIHQQLNTYEYLSPSYQKGWYFKSIYSRILYLHLLRSQYLVSYRFILDFYRF